MALRQSIYVGDELGAAIGQLNDGKLTLSRRINQIGDRYAEILKSISIDGCLSPLEWSALQACLVEVDMAPAGKIRELRQIVADQISLNRLDEVWNVSAAELLDFLEHLAYPELVAIVEAVEAFWKKVRNPGYVKFKQSQKDSAEIRLTLTIGEEDVVFAKSVDDDGVWMFARDNRWEETERIARMLPCPPRQFWDYVRPILDGIAAEPLKP